MTSEVMGRLSSAKARADAMQRDRKNYQTYVTDRIEAGGWTTEDVEEYRGEVERIMQRGTEDEQAAAREFWTAKAVCAVPAIGINDRIKARIKEQKND